MSLKQQLMDEMKQAMKSGDKLKLEVIRLLRSRVKNVEIDQGEVGDEGVQQVAASQIKQWKDALQDYKQGGRQDLVEETEQKIKVLQTYLPQQLTDVEINQIIVRLKQETGLDQPGPLIGKVMAQVGNRAEGSRVAQLVREALN